jgi:K+-transporting ATPase KdpF subunit
MPTPATGCEETTMTFDYTVASIVTVGLLIYLTYALLQPEKF